MTRFFVRWFPALLLTALVVTVGLAQDQSDEAQKRAAFLKARQSESDSGNADESPSPKPKKAKAVAHKSPTPHAHASASAKPKAHKKSAEADEEASGEKKKSTHETAEKSPTHEATTHHGKTSPAAKSAGTKPAAKKEEKESPAKATPAPLASETPLAKPAPSVEKAMPVATAAPTPAAVSVPNNNSPGQPAELTIEKTGYEQPRGFWYRFFHGNSNSSSGRGTGYRYLTASVRAEIDRAPADRRNPPWQFIVVHNSGTRQGNARVFDYYHRHVRHMQNGLAYHFVIGNGTSTGDGQIEIGDRWRRQINGGHVHSDYLNNIALGICLVGDFNRSQPSAAQLQSCEELIRYLRQRCGKVGNKYMVVKPHREMNPPRWPTDCPGDAFPYSWFKRFQ